MRAKTVGLVALLALVGIAAPAHAQTDCSRVVVFTLPGVTWQTVADNAPDEILAAMDAGASGSLSVRTNSSRTSYGSGFATIGAGTRLDGGSTTGGPTDPGPPPEGTLFETDIAVAGLVEIGELADRAGYDAVPGALVGALGGIETTAIGNAEAAVPPSPVRGYERWPLLAAMDPGGVVARAATHSGLVEPAGEEAAVTAGIIEQAAREALNAPCGVVIVDHGDLIRAEQLTLAGATTVAAGRATALESADALLGEITDSLDAERDLLLVVSPTSPLEADEAHFGVAIAVGPGFEPGSSLSSATTRLTGVVTLPDIAPTILAHQGIARPPSMLGRSFRAVDGPQDRIAAALELDRESTFVDGIRTKIWTGYVILQLVVYGAIGYRLWRRRRVAPDKTTVLQAAALGLLCLPVSTFLLGGVSGHTLGDAGYVLALLAIDAALTGLVWFGLRHPIDRVLAITAVTTGVLLADLVLGSRLQLNTVFSYSPIVAGRFTGIGNIAFAILGSAAILSAALAVRRIASRTAGLTVAAALFLVTVVVDGAPAFGSDVGGVLALVPSLGFTWILLWGRRIGWRAVVVALGGTAIALGVFVWWDLSLPEGSRTHLGRFYEDVTQRGPDIFFETIGRKLRANFRVFTSTIWTYLVPPLLFFVGWLLWRPAGRWKLVAQRYPAVRAGILGGLILAALGFAVNDSGIVVPAMVLSMLVPAALIVHLMIEREAAT